jgi:folylpolyglutamate synthase/dihydropteroate synthase
VQEHVSVEDALAGARAQAGTEDVLLATGSLVLVGAVRALTVVRA